MHRGTIVPSGQESMTNIYGADLAHIHHAGFRRVPEAAAAWLQAYLARQRVPAGIVLDLACGTGVFAAHVTSLGRPVVGIDIAPAMIRLARRAAPRAQFQVGSIYDQTFPTSAIVAAVGEGLNYVPATMDPPPLPVTWKRVWNCLLPGGLFLLDLVTGPLRELAPRRGFELGHDWAVMAETRTMDHPRRLERRIATFRQVGATYRRGDEVHLVEVYDRSEVLATLRSAGFRVRWLKGYSASARLPGRTVFVARKPSDSGRRLHPIDPA